MVSTAFWIWTPRYLLRGRIGLRPLVPGALLASLAIGGATATSRFFVGPSLQSDGRHFGSFGVVGALLAWDTHLGTTARQIHREREKNPAPAARARATKERNYGALGAAAALLLGLFLLGRPLVLTTVLDATLWERAATAPWASSSTTSATRSARV